jgi:hypothetical protein
MGMNLSSMELPLPPFRGGNYVDLIKIWPPTATAETEKRGELNDEDDDDDELFSLAEV